MKMLQNKFILCYYLVGSRDLLSNLSKVWTPVKPVKSIY